VSREEQPRQAAFANDDPLEEAMAKVVRVLYDDPVTGYPKSYARDDIPKLQHYPDGQEYLIVAAGHLAGAGAHSYSAGDVTGGSEEAARFKR
jgi:hypothetical protein